MQCGLMCGIWDWQSTIVGDLNDSQDPKHTLFCRENAFVAIYAQMSNKCPLFTRLGGGGVCRKGTMSPFFTVFFYIGAPLSIDIHNHDVTFTRSELSLEMKAKVQRIIRWFSPERGDEVLLNVNKVHKC